MTAFDIRFDVLDEIDDGTATSLIDELVRVGTSAEIKSRETPQGILDAPSIVMLIGAATASTAALSVVAAFMYRVFQRGLVIDLEHSPPRVKKNPNLPRGTVLIIYSDGKEELRQGISDDKVGELLATVLSSHAKPTEQA